MAEIKLNPGIADPHATQTSPHRADQTPMPPVTDPRLAPDLPGRAPAGGTGTTPDQMPAFPDAALGRDPSQQIAAEHLRITGGGSATDILLGLNLMPTICGSFPPPPGNREILRHMSPSHRRSIIRTLLTRQRGRMQRLATLLPEEQDEADAGEDRDMLTETGSRRARRDLGAAADLLDLLDEMLEMQDYTISQMGSFSKG
ncbi:MAG: hypothetical protein ACKV2V_07180 [Blastocatellia bacterium]